MSEPIVQGPIIQGWCPGALRPMMSGDGLVVRVRLRFGRISGPDLARLAELSARYGNGIIDFSSRANVQLRGVSALTHPPLIEALRDLGLIDADAQAEARRNIVTSPLWTEGDGTQDLARDLMAALTAPDAPQISGKFGFAIEAAGAAVLRAVAADIRLERIGAQVLIRAEGAETGALVSLSDAAQQAVALARWFVESGGVSDGRGRMPALLARGAALPDAFRATKMQRETQPIPDAGPSPLGAFIGFEFGQVRAETVSNLAQNADFIRVTPWQMLLLENAPLPEIAGLITTQNASLRRVFACTGAPDCPQALQPTRPLARALAPRISDRLHISGCAKGCAAPSVMPLTLVATDRGFNLVKNGTAKDTPCQTDLTVQTLLERPEILEF